MKHDACRKGKIKVHGKCIPKNKAQPTADIIPAVHRLTLKERKLQKKTAQKLHKTLNKKGIKVQLKGDNDEYNRSIIQLPEKLWLFVGIDKGKPDYTIGLDRCQRRTGCADKVFYDDQELLLKELPDIIEEQKHRKPIKMEIKCEIDKNIRCVNCDGKAGPYVSSGGDFSFGVCNVPNLKAEAERFIKSEEQWMKNSYPERKIITKTEIKIIKKKKKRERKK